MHLQPRDQLLKVKNPTRKKIKNKIKLKVSNLIVNQRPMYRLTKDKESQPNPRMNEDL